MSKDSSKRPKRILPHDQAHRLVPVPVSGSKTFQQFCLDAGVHDARFDSAPTANLAQVYTVYRSMQESGLWKEVRLCYDKPLQVYFLRSIPVTPDFDLEVPRPTQEACPSPAAGEAGLSNGPQSSHSIQPAAGNFADQEPCRQPEEGANCEADDTCDVSKVEVCPVCTGAGSSEERGGPEAACTDGTNRLMGSSAEALTVPFSTAHAAAQGCGLTLERLHSFFSLRRNPSSPISLAVVDGNAFVTFNLVHNFLQPPTKAPVDEFEADDLPTNM